MKSLVRIGFCCTLGCMLAGGLMAQRGGGGHGGGGGFHGGGGTGGFRGGGGIVTGGFRGGYGGIGYGRGMYGNYGYGYGRGIYGGYGYGAGLYGWGGGLGYYGSPYYGYGDDPSYSAYTSGYAPPVEYNPSPNVTVIYPAAPQAQPVYDAPVRPMMRSYDQYGQEVDPSGPASPSSGSPIYLIAMKDQTIRAAAAYWVDGRTLHYLTLQHEEKQAPLDSVDRGLSSQLNRERRVGFQLPQ